MLCIGRVRLGDTNFVNLSCQRDTCGNSTSRPGPLIHMVPMEPPRRFDARCSRTRWTATKARYSMRFATQALCASCGYLLGEGRAAAEDHMCISRVLFYPTNAPFSWCNRHQRHSTALWAAYKRKAADVCGQSVQHPASKSLGRSSWMTFSRPLHRPSFIVRS